MIRSRGLREILETVAQRMQADFQASGLIEHRGSKGSVRERNLRIEFLDRYLPSSVAVLGSSEVVDSTGASSGQCDLLIVDPKTPPLWASEDLRVVPAECVHIVIELKSNLTVNELRSAWESVRRVKKLTKTAYMPQSGPILRRSNVYGRYWEHSPTIAQVFAFDGATLETLGDTFAELSRSEPDPALRLDSVFVLNRGMLIWEQPGTHMVRAIPQPGDFIRAAEGAPHEVLMGLMGFLNVEVSSIIERTFDPRPYLTGSLGIPKRQWVL